MGTLMLFYTFTRLPQFANPYPCIPHFHNPKHSSNIWCSRPNSSSKTQWGSNTETVGSGRFHFDSNLIDDDDYVFGPRRGGKRQNWWSDDLYDGDNDDDDLDEEEEPSVIGWIFKVARAFGWMLPAIFISTLLDTGPNALIMAVALPLGQTALSLLMDRLWAVPRYDPVPRSRPKKKRPTSTASRTKPRGQAQGGSYSSGQDRRGYQSWASESRKGDKSGFNFGGWDELDKRTGSVTGVHRKEQIQTAEGRQRVLTNGKFSKRGKKEEPFFLRLLVAVFPFLGFWTRLLL